MWAPNGQAAACCLQCDSGRVLTNDQRNWGPMIRGVDPDVLATITLQGLPCHRQHA